MLWSVLVEGSAKQSKKKKDTLIEADFEHERQQRFDLEFEAKMELLYEQETSDSRTRPQTTGHTSLWTCSTPEALRVCFGASAAI